ncbi:MAG: transposase [Kiritimatiellia bacterium]
MARKPRALFEGGIYHVTSRGNDRQTIFRDTQDRERFLDRLAESAQDYQIRIYLFCLMPNHFHLLLETPLGNLDRFMGSLLTGYSVYFNRRHQRVGHLVQGRYGAQVVERNDYLLKLSRYIHLNPVQTQEARQLPLKERIVRLRGYRWSSFVEYAGRAKPCGWLTTGPILAMLSGACNKGKFKAYARYVEAGLARTDEEFDRLMKEKGIAVGSESFMAQMKNLHERTAVKSLNREDISFRQLRTLKDSKTIEVAVREIVGDGWKQFQARKAGGTVRAFTAWALRKYAGQTQREIAPRVGVKTGAGVSVMIRVAEKAPETAKWRQALDLILKG